MSILTKFPSLLIWQMTVNTKLVKWIFRNVYFNISAKSTPLLPTPILNQNVPIHPCINEDNT